MKKMMLFILAALLLTVSAAYAGDLEDVMNAGVLQFGVSPERSPFAFYDENDDLTGIDIKLMEEIARRMGLKLEVTEMSSDDLIDSLEIGQIDVAGGAFSRTDSRREVIDFSSIYYKADAVAVIFDDPQYSLPVDPTSFEGKKVGVQKNSGFEEWLKNDLVEKGGIQKRDIYTYDKMSDALKALDRKRVDAVLMDSSLFQSRYQNDENYRSYAYAEASDSYAFGFRKGSDLRTAVNQQLSALLKDGTAQEIADTFFSMVPPEETSVIQWNQPKPTATPLPTAPSIFPVIPTVLPTAVPTAAPAAASCNYTMSYVSDITIPDGQPISAGSSFTKTWRLKNTGNCAWTTSFMFTYSSGAQMSGMNRYLPYQVNPGETIDISVDLVAPTTPGTYQGYWQIKTPSGFGVGFPIWVQIVVPGTYSGPTATPYIIYVGEPTATPAVPFMPKYPLEKAATPTPTPLSFSTLPNHISPELIETLDAINNNQSFPSIGIGDLLDSGYITGDIFVASTPMQMKDRFK